MGNLQNALAQEDLLPERAPSKLEEVLSGYDLLEFTIDGRGGYLSHPPVVQSQTVRR